MLIVVPLASGPADARAVGSRRDAAWHGSSDSGESVTRDFPVPGIYLVALEARDCTGNVDSSSQTVCADVAMPEATFPPPDCPQSLVCNFDGSSSSDDAGIETYRWDFNDGTPPQFGALVTHAFPEAGIFSVRLTVTDCRGNEDEFTLSVQPDKPPVVDFEVACNIVRKCELDASSSSDDFGIATYRWDFGDGTPEIETTEPAIDHRYLADGEYTVTLTVVDAGQQHASAQRTIQTKDLLAAVLVLLGED